MLSLVNHDSRFSLQKTADVANLADQMKKFRELKFIKHESQFWPERYIAWSEGYNCVSGMVSFGTVVDPYSYQTRNFTSSLLFFTKYCISQILEVFKLTLILKNTCSFAALP